MILLTILLQPLLENSHRTAANQKWRRVNIRGVLFWSASWQGKGELHPQACKSTRALGRFNLALSLQLKWLLYLPWSCNVLRNNCIDGCVQHYGWNEESIQGEKLSYTESTQAHTEHTAGANISKEEWMRFQVEDRWLSTWGHQTTQAQIAHPIRYREVNSGLNSRVLPSESARSATIQWWEAAFALLKIHYKQKKRDKNRISPTGHDNHVGGTRGGMCAFGADAGRGGLQSTTFGHQRV